MTKQVLKVGQLARPARSPNSGIRFGALVRIEGVCKDGVFVEPVTGDVLPIMDGEGWDAQYHWFPAGDVKLAKQANKREGL